MNTPCLLGRVEYDGARYCHEHGGFLEAGVGSRRCHLADEHQPEPQPTGES